MEASKEPQFAMEGDPSQSAARTVEDRQMIEATMADDQRLSGFARLYLMVNTVFERLTRY